MELEYVNQMNCFMGEVLAAAGVTAPDSFRYSWHSLRHSAASSCKAINVADSKIMFLHNWKSMAVAYATYIDPLCPATPACYRFFGWLLPPARPRGLAGDTSGRRNFWVVGATLSSAWHSGTRTPEMFISSK